MVGGRGAPEEPEEALRGVIMATQSELRDSRAFIAASRVRSLLRSRRALALLRAWAAWQHASFACTVADRTDPLMRELAMLRGLIDEQRERGEALHSLRRELAESRSAATRLETEREAAHSALVAELSSAQAALAASQAEAAALRNNEAALRDELGGASVTLREGFAEAAVQGARLAADAHGRQLVHARLSAALQSARSALLATALRRWAVGAAAATSERERSQLRTANASLEHACHLAHRRCVPVGTACGHTARSGGHTCRDSAWRPSLSLSPSLPLSHSLCASHLPLCACAYVRMHARISLSLSDWPVWTVSPPRNRSSRRRLRRAIARWNARRPRSALPC